MKFVIHPDHIEKRGQIESCIENFGTSGKLLGEAGRNTIKIFDINGFDVNIKSFRIPMIINSVAYRYFRKSKAQRSYEYANILLSHDIGTPQPIAYAENTGILGLKDSYYISEQLKADLMYRDLLTNPNYPDKEEILRQYAHFAFRLHEKGIEFIDNTSGNTLIKKLGEKKYSFYLVDLNRMNFHGSMSFNDRISNLAKLTTDLHALEIMSDEYAKLIKMPFEQVYGLMSKLALGFKNSFDRRRRMKRKLKFWKK